MLADTTVCIAASVEAKTFGVKTGTRVADARRLCPGIEFVVARHELYIDSGNGDWNDSVFRLLYSQRESIEEAYGRPLTFEDLPNRRASRIAEYRPDADVMASEKHEEYISWFIDCSRRLRLALSMVDPGPLPQTPTDPTA